MMQICSDTLLPLSSDRMHELTRSRLAWPLSRPVFQPVKRGHWPGNDLAPFAVVIVNVDSTEHLAMPFIIHSRGVGSPPSQLSHSSFRVQPVEVTVPGLQSSRGSATAGEVMPKLLVTL